MRTILSIFVLLSISHFGTSQIIYKPKKNYFNYNLGNSTPLIGINYMRGFGYSKPNKPLHHFEYGLGVGVQPFFNGSKSNRSDLVLSHNFAYVRGKGKTFLALGYNGIIAEPDALFGNIGIYTPNPYVGFRLEYNKMVWNLNLNGYFYRDKKEVIKDVNSLYERTSTRFLSFPGASLGWKF